MVNSLFENCAVICLSSANYVDKCINQKSLIISTIGDEQKINSHKKFNKIVIF